MSILLIALILVLGFLCVSISEGLRRYVVKKVFKSEEPPMLPDFISSSQVVKIVRHWKYINILFSLLVIVYCASSLFMRGEVEPEVKPLPPQVQIITKEVVKEVPVKTQVDQELFLKCLSAARGSKGVLDANVVTACKDAALVPMK